MKQLSFVELAKITGGITGDPDEVIEGDPDEVVEIVGGGNPDDQDHSNQD